MNRRGIETSDQLQRELLRRRLQGHGRRRRRSSETTSSVWERREQAILSKLHSITFKKAKQINKRKSSVRLNSTSSGINNSDVKNIALNKFSNFENIATAVEIGESELQVLKSSNTPNNSTDNSNNSKTALYVNAVECVKPAKANVIEQKTYSYELSNLESCHCVICLCDFEDHDNMQFLPCGHYFHSLCIKKWFLDRKNVKIHCPVCLQSVFEGKKLKVHTLPQVGIDQQAASPSVSICASKNKLFKTDNQVAIDVGTKLNGFDAVAIACDDVENITPLATHEHEYENLHHHETIEITNTIISVESVDIARTETDDMHVVNLSDIDDHSHSHDHDLHEPALPGSISISNNDNLLKVPNQNVQDKNEHKVEFEQEENLDKEEKEMRCHSPSKSRSKSLSSVINGFTTVISNKLEQSAINAAQAVAILAAKSGQSSRTNTREQDRKNVHDLTAEIEFDDDDDSEQADENEQLMVVNE